MEALQVRLSPSLSGFNSLESRRPLPTASSDGAENVTFALTIEGRSDRPHKGLCIISAESGALLPNVPVVWKSHERALARAAVGASLISGLQEDDPDSKLTERYMHLFV